MVVIHRPISYTNCIASWFQVASDINVAVGQLPVFCLLVLATLSAAACIVLAVPLRWDLLFQGGPKNRTCLSVDNLAMVTRRKAYYMSKVLKCCRQKGPNLHSKSFKYSLPNLHKSLLPLK